MARVGTLPYSDEFKAQVMADLALKMPLREAAVKWDVSVPTLRSWKNLGHSVQVTVSGENAVNLGELTANYLDKALRGMAAIAEQALDPEWRKRQDADKLGIFFGILADKTIRVAQAVEPIGQK